MKVTIIHILSLYCAGFALIFSDYELKLNQINNLPNLSIQYSKIDSLEKLCHAKQNEVNKELEGSIKILQDSQTYILQCTLGVPLGFDSVCVGNSVTNN